MLTKPLSFEYFAGLIDGEGSFGLYRSKAGGIKGPVLKIEMSHPGPMVPAAKYYRRPIQPQVRRSASGRRIYRLVVDGRASRQLLMDVVPHLLGKKEEALELLRFFALRSQPVKNVSLRLAAEDRIINRIKRHKHVSYEEKEPAPLNWSSKARTDDESASSDEPQFADYEYSERD